MSLEIVRIEKAPRLERYVSAAPETITTRLLNGIKRRPALALAAAPFAVAGALPTALAAGAAAIGIGGQELLLRRRDRPPPEFDHRDVERLFASDLVGLTDSRGKTLQYGTYYIRHPIHSRRHLLIPARLFHKTIFEEQMAEIIEFVRSRLSATKITIDARSEKSGSMVVGGSIESIPIGAKLGFGKRQQHAIKFSTRSPKPIGIQRDLPWIADFPVIAALAAEAQNGDFEKREATDLAFGLTAEIADVLGIDLRWVSTFSLDIKVECA